MKKLLLLIGLFVLKTGFSQNVSFSDSTSVVVHKDPRVDALVKKQAAVNAAIKRASARSMKGYRLLILNTNKRNEAIDAKAKIYTYFPDLKAYLVYQTPYFKLKAGNFRTRDEADRYRKSMASIFPKGVFIINDTIEITPEKDKENENE
jgi:SPOR domain